MSTGICNYCGSVSDDTLLNYWNDGNLIVCNACSHQYVKCTECGKYILIGDSTSDNNNVYCQDCMENKNVCCDCGRIIGDDDTYTHDNEVYCESCFYDCHSVCDACGESYDSDDIINVYDNNYCQDCYNDCYTSCDNCGETISRDEQYCNDDGDTYCESCFQDIEDDTIIHNHNYNPIVEFYGKDDMHIGLEYEVYNKEDDICNSDCAEKVLRLSKLFYVKDDSSINNGFEIVTHPATLEYHRKKVDYEKLTSLLKSNGFSSDSKNGNCGVHVHIERGFIEKNCGQFTSAKYGLFIKCIQKYAEILSRRSESRWANYNAIGKSYYKTLAGQGKKPYHSDKYSAINYQHDATIETRIFAGTIRAYRLLAAMEFCHAVVSHVANIGYSHIHSNYDYVLWNNFTSFVKSNNRLYTNLLKNMNEFNMIGA